jgi:hypothetical protein
MNVFYNDLLKYMWYRFGFSVLHVIMEIELSAVTFSSDVDISLVDLSTCDRCTVTVYTK